MGMWDSAVLTNSGLNLMAQWVDGAVLTIDKATAGEGTVNEAYLMGQTQLVAEKKQLSIVRQDRVANGVRIQMQCTNEGVAEEFTINQIGVWAHLNDGASVLLSIYQDDTGVLVPTNAEMPEYVFTFYAVLQVSNTGTLQVTLDASAVVTQGQLEAATAAIDAEIEKIVDGTTEVGHATNADHAASADTATNADEATNATYAQTASTADTAGYATTAKGDANGNDIAATYATKSELAEAGQFDPNGSYPNMSVGTATNASHATEADSANNAGHATSADTATNATNATNDALGRNIANTYALISEVGENEYVTYYTIVNPSSGTDRIYFSYEAKKAFYNITALVRDMRVNYYSLEGCVAASGYWNGQIVVGLYVDKSTGIPGTLKAYCIGGQNLQPSTVTISSDNTLNTRSQG